MLPDRVSNPGPLTYESGALPIVLRGPANFLYVNDLLHPVVETGILLFLFLSLHIFRQRYLDDCIR